MSFFTLSHCSTFGQHVGMRGMTPNFDDAFHATGLLQNY